jgi:hypothetical protein
LAADFGKILPPFPQESYCVPGSLPVYKVGAQQVSSKEQGSVLYNSHCVFDAIGDLGQIEPSVGGIAEYCPATSILQLEVCMRTIYFCTPYFCNLYHSIIIIINSLLNTPGVKF